MDIDGMGEPTVITELIKAKVGATVSEIVDKAYKNGTGYIASMSTVVFDAYLQGDKTAEKILFENAKSLAEIINHAASNYNCGNKLIISGGIITQNKAFAEIIKNFLDPKLELIIPKLPQIIGACILCAKSCGVSTDRLGETLFGQY